MKVVLLAGGMGTRISEESHLKPKPMIEIGNKPILWHIMKHYSRYGFNDFIICLGYRGYVIKEYFSNYFLHASDVTFDLSNNTKTIHSHQAEPWRVTLVETGLETMTGGRVKRIKEYVGNEPFMLTYGDGVADIDLKALLHFHKQHGKKATVTAVQPQGRFGLLDIGKDEMVAGFQEKPEDGGSWINGGFFVFQPEIFNLLEGDETILERKPMDQLSDSQQLMAYRHPGFWQCMDTLRDKTFLDELWLSGDAPWQR